MYFRDGRRRIDFVLSYVDDKDGERKQVRNNLQNKHLTHLLIKCEYMFLKVLPVVGFTLFGFGQITKNLQILEHSSDFWSKSVRFFSCKMSLEFTVSVSGTSEVPQG